VEWVTESRDVRRRRRQRLVIVGVVVFAMLASTLAAVVAAFADPSAQPGGTSAVLDTPELDALQERAGQIQGQLQDRQAAVADILSRLESAREQALEAQTARREADVGLAARQHAIAGYASAIYRDGSAPDELRLFLTYRSPGDMVAALGYLDAVRSFHEQGVADAERARRHRHRRTGELSTPPPGTVRAGDHERGSMRAFGNPSEHGCREIGGTEVDGAHVGASA